MLKLTAWELAAIEVALEAMRGKFDEQSLAALIAKVRAAKPKS